MFFSKARETLEEPLPIVQVIELDMLGTRRHVGRDFFQFTDGLLDPLGSLTALGRPRAKMIVNTELKSIGVAGTPHTTITSNTTVQLPGNADYSQVLLDGGVEFSLGFQYLCVKQEQFPQLYGIPRVGHRIGATLNKRRRHKNEFRSLTGLDRQRNYLLIGIDPLDFFGRWFPGFGMSRILVERRFIFFRRLVLWNSGGGVFLYGLLIKIKRGLFLRRKGPQE